MDNSTNKETIQNNKDSISTNLDLNYKNKKNNDDYKIPKSNGSTSVVKDKNNFNITHNLNETLNSIRKDIVGDNLLINTVFGEKRLIYADHTASGKALNSIENYILQHVHPYYANSHSELGFLAEQSNKFRTEAKSIIKRHFNADERDAVVLSGQGATGAVNKLVRILNLKDKVKFYNSLKEALIILNNFKKDIFIKELINSKNWNSLISAYNEKQEYINKSNNYTSDENNVHDKTDKEIKLDELNLNNINFDNSIDNLNEDEKYEFLFVKLNQTLIKSIQSKFKEIYEIHNFLVLNRWNSYDCILCKMTFEKEAQYNKHTESDVHKKNLENVHMYGKGTFYTGIKNPSLNDVLKIIKECKKFKPVVFLSVLEHNSNSLPWRETGAEIVYVDKISDSKGFDYEELIRQVHIYKDRHVKIGSFIGVSNATGEQLNVDVLAIIMHEVKGLAFFDYATGAPYLKIDMNNLLRLNFENGGSDDIPERYKYENLSEDQKKLAYKDGLFFSPHKFLGGPNTTGTLIIKQHVVRSMLVPADTGGGIILFVTKNSENYVRNIEEREEPGTPDVISSCRIALAILNKEKITSNNLMSREHDINIRVINRLSKIKNLIIVGGKRKKNNLAIYSFMIKFNKKFLHFNFITALLNDLFGIQSRGGCACASTYANFNLKISDETLKDIEHHSISGKEILKPGYMRVNFHYCYSDEEINYILDAIEFISVFGWLFLSQYNYKIEGGKFEHINKPEHRLWLEDYLSYYSNNLKNNSNNFLPKSQKYDDYTFDIYKRFYYLNKAMNTLNNISRITKNAIGKSKINHSIVFNQNGIEHLRWFLIPEDVEELYNESVEKLFSKIIDNDKYEYNLKENIDMNGNLFSNHKLFNIKNVKLAFEEKYNTCFGPGLENILEHAVINKESNIKNKDENKIVVALDRDKDIIKSQCKAVDINKIDNNTDLERINCDIYNNTKSKDNTLLFPKVPKSITSLVGEAIIFFKMINNNDKVLIGLSGGKDSMSLIHILLYFKKHAPIKFDLGVVTVDPQSDDYKPEPLKEYISSLGLPYFYESDPILERAKSTMKKEKESICAYCSRMKRGIIYACARREKYNVIALGQHLDDIAESFLMSSFHNGLLRTMKANYTIDAGDLRVIRPLIFCREKLFKEFAQNSNLPIIQENCPACFSAPKERHRVKVLLSQQENLFPSLFSSLQKALIPLMKGEVENGENKKDDINI